MKTTLNSALNSLFNRFLFDEENRREKKKNEWKLLGQNNNNNQKKVGKKGNYHPIKDSVVTDIMGAIKVESSTITAAAGSLRRGSDNGPEGKRQRAQGPGIVRKTDKKTQEQVIS